MFSGWTDEKEHGLEGVQRVYTGGADLAEAFWLRGTLQGRSGNEPLGAEGHRDRQHHVGRDWWQSWGLFTQVFLSYVHDMKVGLRSVQWKALLG